jgi:high-affinity iron transporter
MGLIVPGMIVGFREGLEAFLIIAIILRFLKRSNRTSSVRFVWQGALLGVALSLLLGGVLYWITRNTSSVDPVAKLWEAGASVFALVLVTTFIVWMIKNGSSMTSEVESKVQKTLSNAGIFVLAFAFVAREGVEIAIFTFAGSYSLVGISIGILISLVLTVLVFFSLVKVNLSVIFNVTLVYLILQAGFLLGYAVHEDLSAFKDLGLLDAGSPVFVKLFDLSGTVLDHKTGLLGLPLYVAVGWYSKPEIVQFAVQYLYTIGVFAFWWRYAKASHS